MELSEPLKFTRKPKSVGMPDKIAAYHSQLGTKLQDSFISDQPTSPYAGLHHQPTRNADSYLPHSSGSQHNCAVEGKAEEDELVRYMSNLPSYLEKGKSLKEKPLNIGVLDWRHLEKWNYNNDLMPLKSSDYTSTSSTPYFSKECLPSRSSRGQRLSPARQTMHCSSLESHLDASPMKTPSQAKFYPGRGYSYSPVRQRTYHLVPHSHHQKIYPWESHSQNVTRTMGSVESPDKIKDISASRIAQQTVCQMDRNCRRNQSEVRLETCKKKESVSNTTSKTGMGKRWQNATDVVPSSKGNLMIRESELKEAVQSRIPNQVDHHPDCSKKHRSVVLLMPKDPPVNQLSDSAMSANLMPGEHGGRKSASRKDSYKDANALLDDRKGRSGMGGYYSTGALGAEASSQQLRSPASSRNSEERKRIVVLKSPSTTNLSAESEKITGSESTIRARHSSPIRRLSFSLGSIIRSAGSRDNSPMRRSCSKDPATKPGSDSAAVPASSDTDKSPASSRARLSPLRRLLDPLIKPKSPIVRESTEPLRTNFASTSRLSKSSDEQLDLLKAQSLKVNGPSRVHALLQLAVRNGLPLFTLAVDNDNGILAATLRKLSNAEKNCSGWLYTYFTVNEMKKKNALWPKQGSKGNGRYVPNVIAQMKVSDCHAPVCTRQKNVSGCNLREFTLFSVDVSQVDQSSTEFEPADELAAIVVDLPKPSGGSPSSTSINPTSSNATQDSPRSHIPLSTTVILPGGVHAVPSKGSISTLAQRWRSGGACDCGGWDLGCQLRAFTNQCESHKSLTSSKASITSEEFKLFAQVGQESQLVLSLNPFKDRIYSVECDSSISLLQAFAICVAVLDSRRPSGLLSTTSLVEARSSRARASGSGDPARTKPRNQSHAEAPARHVSYLPHYPVGRK